MNRRKLVLGILGLLVFIIPLGFTLGNVAASTFSAKSNPVSESTRLPSIAPHPTTLVEAWSIFSEQMPSWLPNGVLISIYSVNYPDDLSSAGQDGRRRSWQAIAINPSRPEGNGLLLTMIDGIIIEKDEQPGGLEMMPIRNQPNLDSPEALVIAQEAKPSLIGADGKSIGFHFVYESSTDRSSFVFRVAGSMDKLASVIEIDPSKKTIISARSQVFTGGGVLYSADAGKNWAASNLGGGDTQMIKAITSDPRMINQGYAASVQSDRIAIYKTDDGGKTWALMSTLPVTAGNWPFSIRAIPIQNQEVMLAVGTYRGLWVSNTKTETWSAVPGLPSDSVQWLGVIRMRDRYRILANFTTGDESGLYGSQDLNSWTLISHINDYRLSESFDQHYVLASSEMNPGRSLILSIDTQTDFVTPPDTLGAVGDFADQSLTIAWADTKVGNLSISANSWNDSMICETAAAGLDYHDSGTVIVGGFRTGIFVSNDKGLDWRPVLTNPSALIPGSNEIYEIKFLSPENVIAINGGYLTWQVF